MPYNTPLWRAICGHDTWLFPRPRGQQQPETAGTSLLAVLITLGMRTLDGAAMPDARPAGQDDEAGSGSTRASVATMYCRGGAAYRFQPGEESALGLAAERC
jgi:hypothetical protein